MAEGEKKHNYWGGIMHGMGIGLLLALITMYALERENKKRK